MCSLTVFSHHKNVPFTVDLLRAGWNRKSSALPVADRAEELSSLLPATQNGAGSREGEGALLVCLFEMSNEKEPSIRLGVIAA